MNKNEIQANLIKGTILIEDPEIIIHTERGTVRLDSPQTPSVIVQILYEAIGKVERIFPKQTPYPKIHDANK